MKTRHLIHSLIFAIAATLGATGTALAQATAVPATDVITKSVHEAWTVRCRGGVKGAVPCQLFQALNDAQGNAVVEINIFNLPAGQKAAAGVIVVAPLETLLTQELALRVDATKGKRYPFAWCTAVGCVSRIGITADELNDFRQGSEATVTIYSVAAPRQPLTLTISLKGFTAGFNAMLAANQAAAQ